MITITLDRERAIRWTNRAQARNASLARPVSFNEVGKGKRRLYALCAIIWAALVDRDHPFAEPEDVADHLETEEQQVAAYKALAGMLDEAFAEKKSPPSSAPSTSGRGASSSSGSRGASPGGS